MTLSNALSAPLTRACAALIAGLALVGIAQAHGDKHEHGVVHLDLAVEGDALVLQLESPLDSVLGFEHRPRTAEQRQAVDQMLKRLRDGAALFSTNASAGCRFEDAQIESALIASPAGKADSKANPPEQQEKAGKADKSEKAEKSETSEKSEHMDVDATYRFRCASAPALSQLTHQLFATFPRIQRIEAQIATPKGQGKQVLKRPTATLSLGG